ncbi:hypothetical protein MHYP_G00273550 [Metynnis hypsauchen]
MVTFRNRRLEEGLSMEIIWVSPPSQRVEKNTAEEVQKHQTAWLPLLLSSRAHGMMALKAKKFMLRFMKYAWCTTRGSQQQERIHGQVQQQHRKEGQGRQSGNAEDMQGRVKLSH